MGYRERSCLTDEAGERAICPSRNGMFRPIVVRRGRVVAVEGARGDGGQEQHGAAARARADSAVSDGGGAGDVIGGAHGHGVCSRGAELGRGSGPRGAVRPRRVHEVRRYASGSRGAGRRTL